MKIYIFCGGALRFLHVRETANSYIPTGLNPKEYKEKYFGWRERFPKEQFFTTKIETILHTREKLINNNERLKEIISNNEKDIEELTRLAKEIYEEDK